MCTGLYGNPVYQIKTSIYLGNIKLGKTVDIANMIRDKSSKFYDCEPNQYQVMLFRKFPATDV